MQTRTRAEIKNELNQVNKRLPELQAMYDDAKAKAEAAHNDFINDKITVEDLQSARSHLGTLDDSIFRIESTQKTLNEELAAAVREESNQANREKAGALAIEAAEAVKKYAEMRIAFDAFIIKHANEMYEQLELFRSKQVSFRSAARTSEGDWLGSVFTLEHQARLEELKTGLRENEMSDDVGKWASVESFQLQEIESAPLLEHALRFIINKREVEAWRAARASSK